MKLCVTNSDVIHSSDDNMRMIVIRVLNDGEHLSMEVDITLYMQYILNFGKLREETVILNSHNHSVWCLVQSSIHLDPFCSKKAKTSIQAYM